MSDYWTVIRFDFEGEIQYVNHYMPDFEEEGLPDSSEDLVICDDEGDVFTLKAGEWSLVLPSGMSEFECRSLRDKKLVEVLLEENERLKAALSRSGEKEEDIPTELLGFPVVPTDRFDDISDGSIVFGDISKELYGAILEEHLKEKALKNPVDPSTVYVNKSEGITLKDILDSIPKDYGDRD